MIRRGSRPLARAFVLCAPLLLLHAPCVHAQGGGPAPRAAARLPAAPQTPPTSPPQTPAGSRWEIEGYGGLALAGLAPFGSSALPPPGAALTTSSVLFPTRQTPSWFFGDGAALLNDVNDQFDLSARIVPLDAALGSLGTGTANIGGGVRLRRSLTPRVSLELGVDLSFAHGPSSTLLAAAETARSSFESAFAALFATGPFTGVAVSATSAHTRGSIRDISATAALNLHFRKRGAFVPYATLGGGLAAGSGPLPSVTLDGDYRFSVLSDVPIHEHDRVTIRETRASGLAPVGVLGGGVRRDLSARWGCRIDGRVLIGGHRERLVLDATPTISPGSPAGFVESLTNPNLQFSNDPSTGRRSTLGGPLSGFVAFDEGLRTRVLVTVGVFRRF